MTRFDAYKAQYPQEADDLFRMQHRQLPDGWDKAIPTFAADAKGLAGRDASAEGAQCRRAELPWLIGGSADLAPSTKTRLTFDGAGDFSATSYGGRNFHFGVREHAMGAVMNGLSLSKIRPYGSGFLIFSDYGRAPIRLAAIMEIPVIYVFTHDSIGVGEDGPTHQPVEQLLSLRAIPGLVTIRPGDANEVAEAWRVIAWLPAPSRRPGAHTPGAANARPHQVRAGVGPGQGRLRARRRAGRQRRTCSCSPPAARSRCASPRTSSSRRKGIRSRVVSMPSWELFEDQPAGVSRVGAAGLRSPRASPSSRPPPSAGTATSA